MRTERKYPIYQGQIMQVKIEETGKQGDGITRINGFTIIIPKAKVGEMHKIEITAIKTNYAFAIII